LLFWTFHKSADSSPNQVINSPASSMQNDLNPSNTSLSPAGNSHALPSSSPRAGQKRKAPSSGSRGVASLTPDQLAKKRANDREAQRAIRERTKQTIDNLERRIEELTSQQPYQELQAVIRQKDAIQAENDEIRRRLASVMSIIQPIVGAQGLTGIVSPRIDEMSVFNPV
jgi:TolA-binding protein